LADESGGNLNTKATVAGGGFGTLVAVVAGQIPDSYPILKALVNYAAPGTAVGCAAVWVIVASLLRRARRRRDIDSAMTRAIELRDRVCDDPNATPEHKIAVRMTVEKFERLTVELLEAEFTAAAEIKP
jgi:hypothetical protein